jgi:hypothetical protein
MSRRALLRTVSHGFERVAAAASAIRDSQAQPTAAIEETARLQPVESVRLLPVIEKQRGHVYPVRIDDLQFPLDERDSRQRERFPALGVKVPLWMSLWNVDDIAFEASIASSSLFARRTAAAPVA